MRRRFIACLIVVAWTLPALSQGNTKSANGKDIDPLALEILKAVTDPIKAASAFSFRILTARDLLGTNDQIITQFSVSEITVQHPDKLHINFRGHGEPVDLFYNGSGKTVLYSPTVKMYTTISTPTTIDAMLDDVAKKGVVIAVRNFLENDPYKSLTADLKTAYAVGKTTVFDKEVYHLAFTEPGAEWQLWVVADDKPMIRRLEVINKEGSHHPRIVVDFLDWDLNATPSNDMFTFNKPSDAKEIEMLKLTAGKSK